VPRRRHATQQCCCRHARPMSLCGASHICALRPRNCCLRAPPCMPQRFRLTHHAFCAREHSRGRCSSFDVLLNEFNMLGLWRQRPRQQLSSVRHGASHTRASASERHAMSPPSLKRLRHSDKAVQHVPMSAHQPSSVQSSFAESAHIQNGMKAISPLRRSCDHSEWQPR